MEDVVSLRAELAESKKREENLTLRIDELSDFIENASVPLHWVNGSGIIIWANKVELALLGYSKEEYIGKHISNFHADKDAIEDILARLIRKEILLDHPALLKAKNGSMIPVIINSSARWEGDKFIHTRCFTRDISKLKKFEEEMVDLINELREDNKAVRAENEELKKELRSLSNVTQKTT